MTVYDSAAGAVRVQSERERLAALIARATPVEGCGPAIPVAPARGRQVPLEPWGLIPDGTAEGWKPGPIGWRGFSAVLSEDVFDRVIHAAAARHRKAGGDAVFVPPFSPGQVAMARRYRDLVERHDAAGQRCASLEVAGRRSGGTGGEFIDAYIDEGNEIARLRRRIGDGVAMRRVRPSARGGPEAMSITDRKLVDSVCLREASFRAVLKEHRWSVTGAHVSGLIVALAAVLDRMQGYSDGRVSKGA